MLIRFMKAKTNAIHVCVVYCSNFGVSKMFIFLMVYNVFNLTKAAFLIRINKNIVELYYHLK